MKRLKTIPVLLLTGAVVAMGQAPLLQMSYRAKPGGGFTVLATNIYTAPASEYIIDARYYMTAGTRCPPADIDPSGRCASGVARHWSPDFLPGTELQPSAAALLDASSRADAMISARNVAVIYADGQTAGDPVVIRQMLTERRAFITDLQAQIPLLVAAARSAQPDVASLHSRFLAMERDHRAALVAARSAGLPREYGPSPDRVCLTIAAELAHFKGGETPAEQANAIERVAHHMQVILVAALASKPAPPPAPAASPE